MLMLNTNEIKSEYDTSRVCENEKISHLTLFPMGGGRGVSQSIQTISFQTRIELHGRKLDDNMVSSIPHILEE